MRAFFSISLRGVRPAVQKLVSSVRKRSIGLSGHKTSVSLEEAFWTALKEIAASRDATLSDLVSSIDSERKGANLSSALRLHVLSYYQSRQAGRENER